MAIKSTKSILQFIVLLGIGVLFIWLSVRSITPEQKEKMDKHREMMRSLAPEKRELVKKEMERHRAEMKKITGFDLPSPGNPDQQNDKPE